MMSQLKEHRKEHAQSEQSLHIWTDLNMWPNRRYFYCWPTCVETSDNEDAV